MNPGVVDDGGGGVEPHGLGVQQSASELRRIVALEIGGGVGDMGKAGGMALGEAIVAESTDLLKDALGELLPDALPHHAVHQSFDGAARSVPNAARPPCPAATGRPRPACSRRPPWPVASPAPGTGGSPRSSSGRERGRDADIPPLPPLCAAAGRDAPCPP